MSARVVFTYPQEATIIRRSRPFQYRATQFLVNLDLPPARIAY